MQEEDLASDWWGGIHYVLLPNETLDRPTQRFSKGRNMT